MSVSLPVKWGSWVGWSFKDRDLLLTRGSPGARSKRLVLITQLVLLGSHCTLQAHASLSHGVRDPECSLEPCHTAFPSFYASKCPHILLHATSGVQALRAPCSRYLGALTYSNPFFYFSPLFSALALWQGRQNVILIYPTKCLPLHLPPSQLILIWGVWQHSYFTDEKTKAWAFPGVPVVKNCLVTQGICVWPLIGELRSHMPWGN